MKRLGSLAAIMSLFLLGGCAISPGPEAVGDTMCRFTRHALEVEIRDDPLKSAAAEEPSFASVLRKDYAAIGIERNGQPVSPSILVLSGGSQNGAFGTGFLDQWARERPDGTLPRFKVVTGISTGAILSTFAFVNRLDLARAEYSIDSESDVLKRHVRSGGGKISLLDAPAIARKGALGALSPLRAELRRLIDGPMLQRIAQERVAGRSLYAGAVDVDTGQAVIFDMAEMAARYEPGKGNLDHVRNCYVEAIVASSSVPLAAPPAFIDNRMYIDGGARFGVFSDEIGQVIEEKSQSMGAEFDRRLVANTLTGPTAKYAGPNLFVLINGTLGIDPQCGKLRKKGAPCPGGYGALAGRHEDWNLLGLAERSVSILINQTYRFSTLETMRSRPDAGFQPRLPRILPDVEEHDFTMDDPALGSGTQSCSRWREDDVKIDNPVEFHPRYMHCLIDYGRSRATVSAWAKLE